MKKFLTGVLILFNLFLVLSALLVTESFAAGGVEIISFEEDGSISNPDITLRNNGAESKVTVIMKCYDSFDSVINVDSKDILVEGGKEEKVIFNNAVYSGSGGGKRLEFFVVDNYGDEIVMPAATTDSNRSMPFIILTNGGNAKKVTAIMKCYDAAGNIVNVDSKDVLLNTNSSNRISFNNAAYSGLLEGGSLEFLLVTDYKDKVMTVAATNDANKSLPFLILTNGGEDKNVEVVMRCYDSAGSEVNSDTKSILVKKESSSRITFNNAIYVGTGKAVNIKYYMGGSEVVIEGAEKPKTEYKSEEEIKDVLVAIPNASKVIVDGNVIEFDAYTINENNYFKLRDIAFVLTGTTNQFEVGWDGENNAISLISGKAYTPVGGEMSPRSNENKNASKNSSKIYLDEKEAAFISYTINENNYFKLRDIGKAFDFNVSWDGENNSIVINTAESYTED